MAARSLKRKRQPISYREVSSDESFDENSDRERGSPRPARRKSSRIRATSLQSSQDELELSTTLESDLNITRQSGSKVQFRRADDRSKVPTGRTTRRPTTRSRHPVQSHGTSSSNSLRAPKPTRSRTIQGNREWWTAEARSRKIPRKLEKTSTLADIPIPSDGKVPNWSSLPYHVWLQIFVYASHPLCDENFFPTNAISWLYKSARLCKIFAEPALTALYRNLPIVSINKVHRQKLTELLLSPPSARASNYNVKVKCLTLDIDRLNKGSSGKGQVDLGQLLLVLPQLQDVDIFDQFDRPPYRRVYQTRWHYPESLLSSLQTSSVRLKSWRWCSNLFSKQDDCLRRIEKVHQSEAFKGLEKLIFTNFSLDDKASAAADIDQIYKERLAQSLSSLDAVKSLVFESSSIVDEKFLPMLPQHLTRLALTNCPRLTSEILSVFLLSHGSRLKEMQLDHNQALNISFLTDLKAMCPILEVFKMDMNYYNTFATHQDSDPKYEDLMVPEELPQWPSSLRSIEMIHLRNWTSKAAEILFKSLVDSAKDLSKLRVLILKAILDISWRERAGFRDHWKNLLERVFLRELGDPDPRLRSFRTYREWKALLAENPHDHVNGSANRASSKLKAVCIPINNRSHVTRAYTAGGGAHTDIDDASAARTLRSRVRKSLKEESSEEESSGDKSSAEEGFKQGLCHTVDVRIDNLRPREELFHEEDFFDSEVSGDDDWDEDNDGVDNEVYAW